MFESPQTKIDPNQRNTLGLDGTQYTRLLTRLDEVGASNGSDNAARIYRRLSYAYPRVLLSVETQGQSSTGMVVATRNLSQGGCSILHSSFMYPGAKVSVALPDLKGRTRPHPGKVTRCEHRGGILHEVGIKFEKEIRLRDYLTPSSEIMLHSHENIDTNKLESEVLFLSDDVEFGALIRQFLLPTKINHRFEKDAESSMSFASNFPLIVVHHDKINRQAPTNVALLRESGYLNPIILAGEPQSETENNIMHACGADMVIPWPCEQKTFLCSLAEYILNDWTQETLATIRSCISPEIQRSLIAELTVLGVKLDQTIRNENPDHARLQLNIIRQIAIIQTFTPLANSAAALSARLLDGEDFDTLKDELQELAVLCHNMNRQAA